jgi:hypothetical protein
LGTNANGRSLMNASISAKTVYSCHSVTDRLPRIFLSISFITRICLS